MSLTAEEYNTAQRKAFVTNNTLRLAVNLCTGCIKNAPSVGWTVEAVETFVAGLPRPDACDFCARDIDFSPTLGNLDEDQYGTIEPPLAGAVYDEDDNIMTAEEIEARDQAEYDDYTRSIPTPYDWNR